MRTRGWIAVLTVALCIALGVEAIAQRAPPAAKPTRVVLFLVDGTQLSGELIEVTPHGVTVKQNAKSEPKLKRWREIKRVNTGLTREAVLAEWKAQRPDQLCETCAGAALQTCAACEGKSVQVEGRSACGSCSGTGSAGPCKTPRCVEGKTPCPSPCLKPESFTGRPDAEGKRWRSFAAKGGAFRVSDAHVGEVIVYTDGVPSLGGKCPKCEGTTRVIDVACKGTGSVACGTCRGHGVLGTDCVACEDGMTDCVACSGSGLKAGTANTDGVATDGAATDVSPAAQ